MPGAPTKSQLAIAVLPLLTRPELNPPVTGDLPCPEEGRVRNFLAEQKRKRAKRTVPVKAKTSERRKDAEKVLIIAP